MKLTVNFAILPLLILMAVTRMCHFGSEYALPDASLAVFFLAGLYVNSRACFVGLLVAAGLLDYLAITYSNVSDWCVTPAYVFLIPTYGVMWLAGYFCRMLKGDEKNRLVMLLGLMAFATSAAFIISNGSFFLFSGRYEALSAIAYSAAVTRYFPPYLGWAMAYAVAGYGVVKAAGVMWRGLGEHKAV